MPKKKTAKKAARTGSTKKAASRKAAPGNASPKSSRSTATRGAAGSAGRKAAQKTSKQARGDQPRRAAKKKPSPKDATALRRREREVEVEEEKRKRRERAARLLKHHAPPDAQPPLDPEGLADIIGADQPVDILVLAADIRRSTFVMKEAARFRSFAAALNGFVTKARKAVSSSGGWWDKFTGDGFLAYWLYAEHDPDLGPSRSTLQALQSVVKIFRTFDQETIPALRQNSRNFPAGVGLSVGLDAGPAHLVEIGNDYTIVGAPVVGAVRMVSAAKPWELVANNYLGEWLERSTQFELVDKVVREYRATKEYEQQEVYLVSLHGFSPRSVLPLQVGAG